MTTWPTGKIDEIFDSNNTADEMACAEADYFDKISAWIDTDSAKATWEAMKDVVDAEVYGDNDFYEERYEDWLYS